MPSPSLVAVPVHLLLDARPAAPARLTLAYRRARWRAAAAAAVFAAAAVAVWWLATRSPAAPWSVAAVGAGWWAGVRAWRSRYRVASFMGSCPGCGAQLRLRPGTRGSLPRRVSCRVCGAAPVLTRRPPEPRTLAPETLRHHRPDCTGEWRSEWLWDESYLACAGCGVRHPATARLRRIAAEENQRGDLLARLADEGRFL